MYGGVWSFQMILLDLNYPDDNLWKLKFYIISAIHSQVSVIFETNTSIWAKQNDKIIAHMLLVM